MARLRMRLSLGEFFLWGWSLHLQLFSTPASLMLSIRLILLHSLTSKLMLITPLLLMISPSQLEYQESILDKL